MRKTNLIKLLFTLLLFEIVAAGILSSIVQYRSEDAAIAGVNDWEYRLGASPVDSSGLPQWINQKDIDNAWKPIGNPNNPEDRGSYNELWLKGTLPNGTWRDPSLSLQVFEHFQLYADNKLLYQYGSLDPDQRGRYPGTPVRIVPLPLESLGKPIYVHVYSASKDIGITGKAQIGSHVDFILGMLRSDIDKFILGFSYILVAIVFFFISLQVPKPKLYLSFALFLLFFGVYSLCRTSLIYLFVDKPMVWTYTELISLYLGIAGLSFFVEQMFGGGNRNLIRYSGQFVLLYAVISIVCTMINVFTIPQVVIAFQMVIVLVMVPSLVHILSEARNGNKEAGIVFTGLLVTCSSGLFDIVKYLFFMSSEFPSLTHLGIFLFIAVLIYLMVQRVIQMFQFLKQQEKMAVAGRMAAGVAHEIRNPMTVISGFLQLIERNHTHKEKHITVIKSEITRINALLDDFLLFSNTSKVYYAKQSILTLIEETMLLFQPMLAEKDIALRLESEESLPRVSCDSTKIKQVLVNLIKNAIEASRKGGRISILVSKGQQSQIVIRICDQGYGIPLEEQKHIWEPFYTTKESGTGLGLMISLKIVEMHQGRIDVYSEENEGTIFTITLPVQPQKLYS